MPRPPKNKVAEIVKPVIAAPGPARVIDVDNFIRVRDSVSLAPFNIPYQLLATTAPPFPFPSPSHHQNPGFGAEMSVAWCAMDIPHRHNSFVAWSRPIAS